ncbi:MAG: type II secretion system F family protein [Acidimicrobiales bacterium]
MTLAVLCGIGFALGILGMRFGLAKRRTNPAALLRLVAPGRAPSVVTLRLGSPDPTVPRDEPGKAAWGPHRVLGARLARSVGPHVQSAGSLRRWLSATGMSLDQLCAEAVLCAAAGLALPLALVSVLGMLQIAVPITVSLAMTLATGAMLGTVPFLALRAKAGDALRQSRTVLASFVDLVVLGLAGGMGIESALYAAAGMAQDELSRRIVRALDVARHSGATPWSSLAQLGQEIGLDELVELASAVSLAGTEGARVRSTLAAKSTSIRRHQLAEVEAEANTLTERLFIPGAFLLVGFLLFIGYPAVARITAGF